MAEKIQHNINLGDRFDVEKYIHGEIAPKYLNLDNESNYRASTYGYVNELFTLGTNLTAYSLSTIIGECFPNTARLSESILTYASLEQISGITANSSSIDTIWKFEERELRYNNDKVSEGEYIIPKDVNVDISGFKFALEYPISIKYKKINGEYIYTCKYMYPEDKNDFIKAPYIKLAKFREYNRTMIYIYPTLKQINRNYQYKTITSPNMLENISHTFNFNDQLADFNIYYKETPDSDYVYVEKYLEGTVTTPGGRYCFYKLKGENVIEILFPSNAGYFRPIFNSELKVEIETTVGSSGNFTYKGEDITLTYPDDDTDIVYVTTSIQASSDATLGRDRLSNDELQKLVCDSFSLRKTIISEPDLDKYYNSLDINDGCKLNFIKYRDDVFFRIYMSYLLLRYDGTIIPTNSLDAIVYTDDYDVTTEDGGVILSGKKFKYDNTTSSVVCENDTEANLDKELYYSNPYMLLVHKKPNTVVPIIDKYLEQYDTDYTYINDNSFVQFILNSFRVGRDPRISPDISITGNLRVNIDTADNLFVDIDEDGNITDKEYVKIFAGLYDAKGNMFGYMPMNIVGADIELGTYTIECKLKNNNFIKLNEITIEDSLFLPSTQTNSNVFVHYDDINVKIITCIKDPVNSIKYDESECYGFVIPEGYKLTNTYVNYQKDSVYLLKPIKDLFLIEFKNFREKDTDRIYHKLLKLPLIRYDFMKKGNWHNIINNLILSKKALFDNSKGILEENYSLSMKFYNTYGPSKYYTIGRTETIDKVNISISFNIILSNNSKLNSDILREDIKDYIETINSEEMSSVYISELIKYLHNKYTDIVSVIFTGINDYDTSKQSIESLTNKVDREAGYVPEFINFDLTTDINGNFIPDIKIEFI